MTTPGRPGRRPPGGAARRTRGHDALDRPSGTPVLPDELQVARRPVVAPEDGVDRHAGRIARQLAAWLGTLIERDALVVAALVILAAAVRFVGLEARGRFDGDQGHDALVLLRLVRDGSLPLLGPPTSIGDFHHGAMYYYLLAPAAWLSGADPTAIVAWIATLGVAAVATTWWFARSVGGPVAGFVAGLLMAVSPAAIDESTFIWNPNPIPLFAALALGCAWRAHVAGRARWWVPALLATAMVVQLHVLGIVFVPLILGLAAVDLARAWRSGDRVAARRLLGATIGGLLLAALLFVPLLVSELGSGFQETHRVLDFLAGGGSGDGGEPFDRLAITAFRAVGWPLVGLITNAPAGAIVAVTAATVLVAWLAIAGRGPERAVARWLGLGIIWSSVALSMLAPSLQTVVAALPNDHYHSFLDPVVIVLVALAARAVAAGGGARAGRALAARGGAMVGANGAAGEGPRAGVDVAARTVVALAMAALVVLEVSLWPPAVDPNGGWPMARVAGGRIVEAAGGRALDIRTLPIFKTAEGTGFPVVYAGGRAVIATGTATAVAPIEPASIVVIACDRLFEDIIQATCGGPAESAFYEARAPGAPRPPAQVITFDQSARVSVTMIVP